MRLALGLLVAVLMLATMPIPRAGAQADPEQLVDEGLVRLDTTDAAALLFTTTEPGWYVQAPTLHTKVDVAISGPLARTTVTQRFRNSANVFVDGTYVFPLPEGAAVDTLRMRVGDRWVEGRIEGREEARVIFEEAAAAGQVASLVEQQRPNVFTTLVANIAPSADVVIQIEYQQSLAPRAGLFGLRIPLVVAPRYVPTGQQATRLVLSPDGWVTDPSLDRTADAAQSPLVDPRTDNQAVRNPVELSIDLNAGFPLGDINSPYHDVTIDHRNENAATISLSSAVPADRDFYLAWQPRDLEAPYAAAFREHRDNETHFVALVTPPTVDAIGGLRPAREVIFVQDTSGSMSGESIVQAQAGLRRALQRLNETDTFNIIEFNSNFRRFRPEPVQANELNIAKAVQFVDDLDADGGTEMHGALQAALLDSTPDDNRLRQVIFLTDGGVSNEQQMIDLIGSDLGDSRLFTVGIGSAPNSYFMTAAARAGRGSFVFIGQLDEVGAQVETLFAQIETPAIVNLALEGLPAGAVVSPSPLPDLYAGDPVALTIRVPNFTDAESVQLVGLQGTSDWQLDLALFETEQRAGVSKLWAREHIRDLEALWTAPTIDAAQRDDIDDQIRSTALGFGLVSRHTSLVAVDLEVTRPADEASTDAQVPTNLPDGWDPDAFFQAVTSDAAEIEPGLTDRLAESAAADPDAATNRGGVPLPATGAGWELRTALGVAIILGGFLVLGRRSKDSPAPALAQA